MSVVFVIGAGASHGESLTVIDRNPPPPAHPTAPPLTNGFFSQQLFDSIHYAGATAQKDFPAAFDYIKNSRLLVDPVGIGGWRLLDLEQIFTSIELARTFANPESDRAAKATLVRNQLVRYIQRVLGLCTQFCYGQHYKRLVSALGVDDTIITFNWELLLDQELLTVTANGSIQAKPQYDNFWVLTTSNSLSPGTPMLIGTPGQQGMFLKMHGSLNWFLCGNPKCPHSSGIVIDPYTEHALGEAMGIGSSECRSCGSDMLPLLIPPLLHKPITDQGVIRSIWGLARQRLENASKLVVIGFSAAPTDFYAGWLLRSTVGVHDGVEVFVVNPSNDPAAAGHAEFKQRMDEIFPRGYNSDFQQFSQIADILAAVYPEAAAVV